MRKKFFYTAILCALPWMVSGQLNNVPLSSLYMFNGLMINPAYAGSHEVLTSVITDRQQWVGFSGAPTSQNIAVHTPLVSGDKKDNFMALGVMGMFQNSPDARTSEWYVDYAYHFKINNISGGRLSLGLQAGVNVANRKTISNIRSQVLFGQPDAAFEGSPAVTIPNFGFGAYYYTDAYYIGFSVPRFFSFQNDTVKTSKSGPVFSYNQMNFLTSAGIVFTFGPNLRFKPSCMIRYSPALGLQTDINGNFIMFKDRLWLGASYRTDRTAIAILEIQVTPQIKIGYAYDYSLGAIKNYTSGSHEIQLRYELNYRIKAVSPKFF